MRTGTMTTRRGTKKNNLAEVLQVMAEKPELQDTVLANRRLQAAVEISTERQAWALGWRLHR